MFEIGASLAEARRRQGLTAADVERLTRLRMKYIAALEEDRFESLPGRTYARAFLRTYADALGLDADRFVDEFEERFPEPEEELEPLFEPRPRFSVPVRPALAAACVAAFVGAVAWTNVSSAPSTPLPPVVRAAREHPAQVALAVKPATPRHFPLVIRAVSGPCWLLVRSGGATGIVLYEGTLEPGKALSFKPRVWVRLGAPGSVVVRRGAHVVRGLPPVTPVNLIA